MFFSASYSLLSQLKNLEFSLMELEKSFVMKQELLHDDFLIENDSNLMCLKQAFCRSSYSSQTCKLKAELFTCFLP